MEAIFPFIAVWMKYGYMYGYMEATKFVGIAIFSPRSWTKSVVGVINFMSCFHQYACTVRLVQACLCAGKT